MNEFFRFRQTARLYILIVTCFLLGIAALVMYQKINLNDAITSAIAIFGWLILAGITFHQLDKTREEHRQLSHETLRKQLEREAYKDVNDAITELDHELSNLSSLEAGSKMIMATSEPDELFWAKEADKLHLEAVKKDHDVRAFEVKFHASLEANEIALLQFRPYFDYLNAQLHELHENIADRGDKFYSQTRSIDGQPLTEAQFKRAARMFKGISDKVVDLQAFYYDLRIMMMNEFLGEVFQRTVPMRKPADPEDQTIAEVAKSQRFLDILAKQRGKFRRS